MMEINMEVTLLWRTLEIRTPDIIGVPLTTRGLGGRSHRKLFVPTGLQDGRLSLRIEGRTGVPKNAPFIKSVDVGLYLRCERREITILEAKKSFVTSYVGPLIDRLRELEKIA